MQIKCLIVCVYKSIEPLFLNSVLWCDIIMIERRGYICFICIFMEVCFCQWPHKQILQKEIIQLLLIKIDRYGSTYYIGAILLYPHVESTFTKCLFILFFWLHSQWWQNLV